MAKLNWSGLQEGEMARVRQDQEPGVRDGRGNILSVPSFDRVIAVAGGWRRGSS
jgi:hypothetical protein